MLNKATLLFAAAMLTAGCHGAGHTTVVDDGIRSKIFSPCANNSICFADNLYAINWDNSCADYPVSYRAKQYGFETTRTEYVHTVIQPSWRNE